MEAARLPDGQQHGTERWAHPRQAMGGRRGKTGGDHAVVDFASLLDDDVFALGDPHRVVARRVVTGRTVFAVLALVHPGVVLLSVADSFRVEDATFLEFRDDDGLVAGGVDNEFGFDGDWVDT